MSKMEADRIFAEMKQQEAKKKGEENEKLKQFIIAQMVIEKKYFLHNVHIIFELYNIHYRLKSKPEISMR